MLCCDLVTAFVIPVSEWLLFRPYVSLSGSHYKPHISVDGSGWGAWFREGDLDPAHWREAWHLLT